LSQVYGATIEVASGRMELAPTIDFGPVKVSG